MELPPDVLQEVGRRAKGAIRQRMRALRRALPTGARALRSELICQMLQATPEFDAARSIALFAPLPDEVDVSGLDLLARSQEKAVYYPFMDPAPNGFVTGFRRVDSVSDLSLRGRKFLEPPRDAPVAERGDVDLVVVPALALSATGQRLGQGSGFYDVTLPDVCPPALALGVVFDFQMLAELPAEGHDQPVDVVLTDRRVLRPVSVSSP